MSDLRLIDVHAHLQDEKFAEDLPEVIKRAKNAGVTRIVNAGTTVADSRRAVEIAAEYPGCLALIGIHPHEASSFNVDSVTELRSLASEPGVLGIGEIGIDFHYDFSPHDVQIKVFKELWQLAAELQVPAVVHVREAYNAFFEAIAGLPLGEGSALLLRRSGRSEELSTWGFIFRSAALWLSRNRNLP